MAKDKIQKRKEALERQRKALLEVAIPNFTKTGQIDNIAYERANQRVISTAYNARCDRHGNYLDIRYYRGWIARGVNKSYTDNFHNAMFGSILSIEELKKTPGDFWHKSLYDIAYGT